MFFCRVSCTILHEKTFHEIRDDLMSKDTDSSQKGAGLPLVLLAVALFAALFYVIKIVTPDPNKPVQSAFSYSSGFTLNEFTESIKETITSMYEKGIVFENIRFNDSDSLGHLKGKKTSVFDPKHQGPVYRDAKGNLMTSGEAGHWYFNAHLGIAGVGLDGENGSDMIAFLPGITQKICEERALAVEMDVPVPVLEEDLSKTYRMEMIETWRLTYGLPSGDYPLIADGNGALKGKEEGCFQNGGRNKEYVYFRVLSSR